MSVVRPGHSPLTKAQAIVIPRIEFKDATVTEALNFLRRKSIELDPEKKGINFVLKAPQNLMHTKVSLSLTGVSVYEAARYVANLATLVVVPEASALIVRPAGEDR